MLQRRFIGGHIDVLQRRFIGGLIDLLQRRFIGGPTDILQRRFIGGLDLTDVLQRRFIGGLTDLLQRRLGAPLTLRHLYTSFILFSVGVCVEILLFKCAEILRTSHEDNSVHIPCRRLTVKEFTAFHCRVHANTSR